MSNQTSTSKILLALLAGAGMGAVIGAGAALLLSPNDGETNRKILKNKLSELSDDLKDKSDDFMDEIKEILEDDDDSLEVEKEV